MKLSIILISPLYINFIRYISFSPFLPYFALKAPLMTILLYHILIIYSFE